MNRLDALLDALNALDGIEFARDAWINDAPDTYGVLELTGENSAVWADDVLQEQAYGLRVTIYVKDDTDEWCERVQNVLEAFDLYYRLNQRDYDYGSDAVMWQWTATMYGPLTVPDEGEDDG